jgi:2-methylisocitrate lyase-like PEP mutase family enzyme
MSPDDQMEFYARLPRDIDGPVKGLLIPKGYTAKDMANAGYKLLGLPALSIEAAAGAMLEMLSVVLKDGTGEKYFSDPTRKTQSVRAIMEMMHLDEYLALENRFP